MAVCGSSNGGDQRIFSAKPADMNIVGSVAMHWEGFYFSDSMLMISSRKMGDVYMCILFCAIYRTPTRVA